MGMVFQHFNLFPHKTILQNITLAPVKLKLKTKEEAEKRARELLEMVGLPEKADAYPSQLSGGQKQRVAIAGIIAMKPEIIIFDESTAMLDPGGRKAVMDIMERLNKEGITVINITHYMEEATRAGRVIVINDGKIVLDGEPHSVFSMVDRLHEMGLEAPQGAEIVNLIKKTDGGIADGCITEDECIRTIAEYLKRKE